MASPKQGTIEPYGEEDCIVTWQPVPKGVKEDTLRLQVAGGRGAECQLKVSGEATDAKIIFKEKILDLGGLAVGIPVEKTIVVKNVTGKSGSSNPSAFYCESPAPGVTIKPSRGFLTPGQSRELTVVCKPPREYVYKGAASNAVILVRPRGGRPTACELTGEAVIPEVHVLEEEIEFGGVTIGATMRSSLKLENKGSVRKKRRRSNVAVIIVRVIFIHSFLFYCLFYDHNFQTNPNKMTNCFKLFSLLQLYNYISPASLFDI